MALKHGLIAALIALIALAGIASTAHAAHHDADLETLAECVLCTQADRQDEAVPPSGALLPDIRVAAPRMRAHAVKTASVPPRTMTPPGRAPPAGY